MDNHVGTLHVRIFRKRNAERAHIRGIRRCRSNRIIDKRQIIATAGFVIFRRLLSLHLARAVIVDDILVKRIDRRTRSGVRKHAGLHHQLSATHGLEVVVRKIKMLEPVRRRAPAPRRIEAVGILLLIVGVKHARPGCKRVVRLLFLKLHKEGEHFERIRGKGRRHKPEQEQGNQTEKLLHTSSIYKITRPQVYSSWER